MIKRRSRRRVPPKRKGLFTSAAWRRIVRNWRKQQKESRERTQRLLQLLLSGKGKIVFKTDERHRFNG